MAFIVNYEDDDHHKHICVARDMNEIKFLIKRFGKVDDFYKATDKEVKGIINPKEKLIY